MGLKFSLEGKGTCIDKKRLVVPKTSKANVAAEGAKYYCFTKSKVSVWRVIRKRGDVVLRFRNLQPSICLKNLNVISDNCLLS